MGLRARALLPEPEAHDHRLPAAVPRAPARQRGQVLHQVHGEAQDQAVLQLQVPSPIIVTIIISIIINPHLGLINVDPPPLICLSPKNDFINPSSLFIYYQRAPCAAGQHFNSPCCDTGDTSWRILGVILRVILGVILEVSKNESKIFNI